MVAVHTSKHSFFRLKITVGCLVSGVVCVWCVVVVCCGGVCIVVLWWRVCGVW